MLKFVKTTTNLQVKGETYPIKDALKAIGATWDASEKSWILPIHLDCENLRTDLDKKLKKKKVMDALEQKAKDGSFHWVCCEQCEVLCWGKKITVCDTHREWGGQSWNRMRINGRLYTGD
jgi:hypothetical protein